MQKDHLDPSIETGKDLFIDHIVGITEELTTLAVAQDDPLASDVQKHFNGDFASKRSRFFPGGVLTTQQNL